jgi:WD40 repeat protein
MCGAVTMPREMKPTFLVLLFVLIGFILPAVDFAFSPAYAQTANGESKPPVGKFAARLKATLPNYRGPSEIKSTPAILVFSPHQSVIAIRTADKVVSLHETATGKLIASLTDPKRAIDAFAFSPDGRLAATRHIPDKSVRLWDSATGKLIHTLAGHAEVGFFDKNPNSRSVVERKEILPVAFSPDGKRVLTEQDNDTYSVYDTATGELKVKLHHGTKTSKMKNVFANFFFMRSTIEAAVGMYGETTFSPDGRLIVTVDRDKYPKLWDASTGELRATLEAHGSEVYGVLFSPNSKMLITLSVTGTMKLWDTETGSLRYSLGDGKKKFLGAIWDPSGETIALWSPTNKEVWII